MSGQLRVMLALTTRPTESPVWVDVSDRVREDRGLVITRGRAKESESFETGELDCALYNYDRVFDPAYSLGPHYGNLLPMRRVRVSALHAGVDYPLFSGYVKGFSVEYGEDRLDASTPIKAHDAFKILALNDILAGTVMPEEDSGARINRVLDLTGFTTGGAWILDSATNSQLGYTTTLAPLPGDRQIRAGNSRVQAETITDRVNALEYMQRVEQAEAGRLFAAKNGAIWFLNRHYLLEPSRLTPRCRLGDAADLAATPAALPYVYVDVEDYDDRNLVNAASMERRGGTPQVAQDHASILEYYRRTKSDSDLLAVSDYEMADRANWTVKQGATPRMRIEAVGMEPEMDERLWPAALGAELGDRVTIARQPMGIPPTWVEDYIIERIKISIRQRWEVEWQLSPAPTSAGWHVTAGGDEYAPWAVLGTTTVLAY